MLNKEECLDALEKLHVLALFCSEEVYEHRRNYLKERYDLLEQLIKEHFELVEFLKEVGWDKFDADELKTVIKAGQYNAEKLNSLRKPYKFQDLKEGMWVYDSKREYEDYSFIKITRILSKQECEYLYRCKNKQMFFDNIKCHAREFEENRFFPVWMANVEGFL